MMRRGHLNRYLPVGLFAAVFALCTATSILSEETRNGKQLRADDPLPTRAIALTHPETENKPTLVIVEPSAPIIHKADKKFSTLQRGLVHPAGRRGLSTHQILPDLKQPFKWAPRPRQTYEVSFGPVPPGKGPGRVGPKGPRPGTPPKPVDPSDHRESVETFGKFSRSNSRTVLVESVEGGYILVAKLKGIVRVVEAKEVDDAAEFAVVLLRDQAEGDDSEEPLRFVFQGFEAVDAQYFTATCRVRVHADTLDPNIVGYVAGEEDGFKPEAYAADLTKKYNFAGAQVNTGEVIKLGDDGYKLTITIEIPLMRGNLELRERFGRDAGQEDDDAERNVNTYSGRLGRFLRLLLSREQSPSSIRDRVVRERDELRKDLNLPAYDNKPSEISDVEIQFRQGVIDFSIVRRKAGDALAPG